MLNNPFYIGLIHIRKTNELFQGVHRPVIGKTLYDQVQSVLAGNRVGKTLKHDHLFRRLIHCATCNKHLIGERHKGRYVYYRCHTNGCSVSIAESAIDGLLRRTLGLIVLDSREVRDIRDMVEDMKTSTAEETKRSESSLRLQLAQCNERIAKLTDALIDGLIDKQLFEERRRAVLLARAELQDRLSNPASAGSAADRVLNYLELANTAYLSYETGLPSEKRALLVSITSNFSGIGNEPAITLKSPFQELANCRKTSVGDPHRDTPRTRVRQILGILTNAANQLHSPPVTDFKRAA
jgi:hypothetical protein